jgi:hypothetical protein
MRRAYSALVITLVYWLWESQIGGNIRLDLLVIYPLLIVLYPILLWRKFKWLSIVIALMLMVLNILFMQYSYVWFGKSPG